MRTRTYSSHPNAGSRKPKLVPALGLFFLSPLIAEYLLGNLPITALYALVVLAPLYGGGALLIREVARHTGRGWPTILLLALAYGVLEEGIVTMSLFNPNYLGAHLLDNGFIPSLGISGPWTVGVLTLHSVWSISVPIALAEVLAGPRGTEPWLGRVGLVVVVVLFLLGVVMNTIISMALNDGFVASTSQLVGAGIVIVALAVGARLVGCSGWPEAASLGSPAPSPWRVGAASFVVTSLYKLMPNDWSPWLLVPMLLLGDTGTAVAIGYWSRLRGWGEAHKLALAGGPLLTYAWTAFPQTPVLPATPTQDLAGNLVFALGAIILLALAAIQVRGQSSAPPASSSGDRKRSPRPGP